MYLFVMYTFIFSLGAVFGWLVEVVYRHIADPEKRWFNPGFCVGPWLPIYGIGLVIAFLITGLEDKYVVADPVVKKLLLFAMMSLCMTFIELIGGMLLLKFFNLRLWDYREEKFNYKGFICLKFSLYWMIISAVYYFLIHPHISESVEWLSKNLIFSFVVGLAIGVFLVDLVYSAQVVAKIKDFAVKNGIVVKLEELKDKINQEQKKQNEKITFFTLMLKENISKLLPKKENTIQNSESTENSETK